METRFNEPGCYIDAPAGYYDTAIQANNLLMSIGEGELAGELFRAIKAENMEAINDILNVLTEETLPNYTAQNLTWAWDGGDLLLLTDEHLQHI